MGQLRPVFREFDLDQSGSIECEELLEVLPVADLVLKLMLACEVPHLVLSVDCVDPAAVRYSCRLTLVWQLGSMRRSLGQRIGSWTEEKNSHTFGASTRCYHIRFTTDSTRDSLSVCVWTTECVCVHY